MSGFQESLEAWIRQACLIEVRSIKPGNVSPAAAFADASVADFERSAAEIAPILAHVSQTTIGSSILQAVSGTQQLVGHNTNLGIVLLLAPMAAVPADCRLQDGIREVLQNLTVDDAGFVYEAIRVASPGGLGQADHQDVTAPPTLNLLGCMQLSADRDQIAAQYAHNYRDVLDVGLRLLQSTESWVSHTESRMAWLAVSLMAEFGDSLIRRKCGVEMSVAVQQRAQSLLAAGWPFVADSVAAYNSFDEFLRADGNRRNPGATADMIAAIIFAALRESICVADASESQLIFLDRSHVRNL